MSQDGQVDVGRMSQDGWTGGCRMDGQVDVGRMSQDGQEGGGTYELGWIGGEWNI